MKRRRRAEEDDRRAQAYDRLRPGAERRPTWSRRTSSVAIGLVLVAVAIMGLVFATRSPTRSGSGSASGGRSPSAAAIAELTSVSPATLAEIGVPSDLPPIPRLPAGTPAVESGGKPVVTFVSADYCPFCAAERWPLVVALSRFGTFSDLGTTTSSSSDVYPDTPTPSFHGSSYTSDHLVLSAVEIADREGRPLDTPTAQQQQLLSTYDTKRYVGSNGGIPFTMIGNLYAWAGSTYDPEILSGLSFDQIAGQLDDPSSEVARVIDGCANQITAMLCQLTGNRPDRVCSAGYIQQEETRLGG